MNEITTDRAPAPLGAYPHARRAGPFLFLSGIGPRLSGSGAVPGNRYDEQGNLVDYDIAAQCHSVFNNVRAVLESSGAGWDDLIDITVFLTDLDRDFEIYNGVYSEYFPTSKPCRTTLGVSALPAPIAIELKCVALVGHPTGA
jgi:2-aminomuconate deaminase